MQQKSHIYYTFLFLSAVTIFIFFTNEALAIPVEALKAPMQDLKKEIFSWMMAVKIAAVAVGGIVSVAKQSVMPLGIGAGITAGIHFFDKVIGDASGALI
jgi:hypothetical protein